MKIKLYFICALILVVNGCSSLSQQTFSKGNETLENDPSVKVGKLNNGLTYYIKNNEYPKDRLELLLVVNTGSVMEDDDQQGLAHFAEHMAFNGTKKYPKQELVDYLESIGMKFGPDLNAYTSFDETVYMLQLPLEDEEIVEKGFEILSEWAFNISFDNEEIDKERGVIVEEWRLRRGAEQRIRDKKLPIYFKDSKYSERSPIGKMDIVENFEYDTIKRFYKDWYRPDLMAVVAVGDYDAQKIESHIKKFFDTDYIKHDKRERVVESVPSFDSYRVAIGSDPELSMPSVGLTYFYEPYDGEFTEEVYKQVLIKKMITDMLNMRLSDLTKKADPNFIYSGSYNVGRYIRSKEMYVLYAGVQEDKIIDGFKSLAREVERVVQYGFIVNELERVKAKIKNELELSNNEIDKTESRKYKFKYKDHYLTGEPYLSVDDNLSLFNIHESSITIKQVNEIAQKMFSSPNKILDLDFPQKESIKILTEDEIIGIYESILSENIEPYTEDEISDVIFNKDVVPGTIVTQTLNNDLNITEMTLSNGVRVVYKKTDFKNDEILFTAYSPGGHSLISDQLYFSATEAASLISYSGLGDFNQMQLDKFLSNKSIKIEPYIKELTEGLSGSSNNKDLEVLFQMLNLYLTEPKTDVESYKSYMSRMKGFIENKNLSPETVFFDSVKSIINSDHLRSKALTLNKLNTITLEDIESVYKDRFSDVSDFTFIFVGNIEKDNFYSLVNKYLSSIVTINRLESWNDVNKEFPLGITETEIYKGLDQKSFVYLTFRGDALWSEEELIKFKTFTNAFKIKLREVLREEMGGTYGVWVPSSFSKYPENMYQFRVIFGCDPNSVDTLSDALFEQINLVKANGLDDIYLTKAKEMQKNEFDKNLRDNKYWLEQLKSMYFNNSSSYMLSNYNDLVDDVVIEDIKLLANKYLNTNNFVKVVLYPEK